MIYTLTVNPAVDYHMKVTGAALVPGSIIRSESEEMFPGGKGLNVSVILSRLGVENVALGFSAGKVGELLKALISDFGVRCDLISLPEGETRINVKLDSSPETAVNGKGPEVPDEAVTTLLGRISSLNSNDMLVLSGNLQSGIKDLYWEIGRRCRKNGVRLIVDAEGESLSGTFDSQPFLIKPNLWELFQLFPDSPADSSDEMEDHDSFYVSLMRRCQEKGVKNVLLSMGEAGAILLTEEGEVLKATLSQTHTPVSTVGAGDSMLAGFLAGWLFGEKESDRAARALHLACACGTATAYQAHLAKIEDIKKVLNDIKVWRLNYSSIQKC